MRKTRSLSSVASCSFLSWALLLALPGPATAQGDDPEMPNAAALGPVLLTQMAPGQFASVVQDTIEVLSDGVDWTHAKPARIAIHLHLDAQVSDPAKWRIRRAAIVLGDADVQNGHYTPAPDDFALKLRFAPTDHLVDSKVWSIQLNDTLAAMARDACRQNAQSLLIDGMSMAEIMNAERRVTMPVPYRLVLRLGYWDPLIDDKKAGAQDLYWVQSEPYDYPYQVICRQPATQAAGAGAFLTPPPATVAAAGAGAPFRVTETRLHIEPTTFKGECPAMLNLFPAFAAEGAGAVRYRIVDQQGNRSAEQSLTLDLATATPPSHTLTVAADGMASGLGFSGLFRPARAALNLGAEGNPIVEGALQLVVTSPSSVKSPIVPYRLECAQPPKPVPGADAPAVGVAPPPADAQLVAGPRLRGDPDAAADLVIIGVGRGRTPLQVSATIANNGTAPSGATSIRMTLRRADGSTAVGATAIGPIGPGWKQVVILDAGVPLQEAAGLGLDIDAENLVPELNDANNSYRIK